MRKKINRLPLYALLAALALLFCALVSVAFLPFAATDSGFAMPTAVSVVCGMVAVVAVVPLLIALVLRLREARTVLAVIFGLGITLLLLDFTGTVRLWTGWMARIQLLPAVLALSWAVVVPIVLTLVYGRIYCSVICPLGVMQDVIARIGRIGKRRPYNYFESREMGAGPFTFRITDIYGHVIIDRDIPLCEDDTVILKGHVQFPL